LVKITAHADIIAIALLINTPILITDRKLNSISCDDYNTGEFTIQEKKSLRLSVWRRNWTKGPSINWSRLNLFVHYYFRKKFAACVIQQKNSFEPKEFLGQITSVYV
jgi:hypothetical protein